MLHESCWWIVLILMNNHEKVSLDGWWQDLIKGKATRWTLSPPFKLQTKAKVLTVNDVSTCSSISSLALPDIHPLFAVSSLNPSHPPSIQPINPSTCASPFLSSNLLPFLIPQSSVFLSSTPLCRFLCCFCCIWFLYCDYIHVFYTLQSVVIWWLWCQIISWKTILLELVILHPLTWFPASSTAPWAALGRYGIVAPFGGD